MNDGSDKSTDASSKVTLSDQWDHLMDDVIQGNSTAQSSVTYTVTLYRDGATKTYTGVIEDINVTGGQKGTVLTGSFNLTEGR